MIDEDTLDRERVIFELGPSPSRERVFDILQQIAAEHLTQHAARLLECLPRDEATKVINETWLPQLNDWVRDTCNKIMGSLPSHETPSYADACLDGLRRYVH